MSAHVEWMDAAHTVAETAGEGAQIGEHAVTGPAAVVFAADDLVVIEGTPDELRTLLAGALAALPAPAPTTEPDRPAAGWAGSRQVETYVRLLAEDLNRRGLLAEPLCEKTCARITVALAGAFGDRDLGILHARLLAALAIA